MRRITIVLFTCIALVACKTKKEVTSVTDQDVEQEEVLTKSGVPCTDVSNDLVWSPITDKALETSATRFSKDLKIFVVDYLALEKIIENVGKKDESFEMVLPVYINGKIECVQMELTNSGTIDKNMQDRMGIYSFKAFTELFPTIRIDYEKASGLRGYFKSASNVILLESFRTNGTRYYISYDKKTAVRTKKEFE